MVKPTFTTMSICVFAPVYPDTLAGCWALMNSRGSTKKCGAVVDHGMNSRSPIRKYPRA